MIYDFGLTIDDWGQDAGARVCDPQRFGQPVGLQNKLERPVLWPLLRGRTSAWQAEPRSEMRGVQSAQGFTNVCTAFARAKSGGTPDFTGATPVLHGAKTNGLSVFPSFPPFSSVPKNIL